MDLIEKINTKGLEIRNAEVENQLNAMDLFDTKLKQLKALSPRINKMWDIAEALLNNGFKLGKGINRAGDYYYEFETECWYHWLGFYVNCGSISGFGICGGGCCGPSVFIKKNGDVVSCGVKITHANTIMPITSAYSRKKCWYEDEDITSNVNSILNGFDEFERKFYEYAESVVK